MPKPNDIQRDLTGLANKTKGQSNAGNSDLNRGSGNLLPYPGEFDRRDLLLTSGRVRRTDTYVGGGAGDISSQTGARAKEVPASDRRGCDRLDSKGLFRLGQRYDYPSRLADPMYAMPEEESKRLDLGIIEYPQAPNFSRTTKLIIGAFIAGCMLLGVYAVFGGAR